MSTTKLKGFHLPSDLIKKFSMYCKSIPIPESRFIEALIENFFSLPESKQKELIKKFLTKGL